MIKTELNIYKEGYKGVQQHIMCLVLKLIISYNFIN